MAAIKQQPRGPGGRPPKAEHERRVDSLHADATLAEKQHARELASRAGLSLSEFIRRRVLGQPVVVREAKTDQRLVHEINRIGVNLNIMLRDVLSDRKSHPESEWLEVRRKLDLALDRVLESLDD